MAQHVTFARMKVLPGKLGDLTKLMEEGGEARRMGSAGWERTVVGKSKNDPDTVWIAVSWDTSERYYANAESPEQNEWFQKTRALLASDPEWFDCDVIQEQSA
jgi:hypothetical protein